MASATDVLVSLVIVAGVLAWTARAWWVWRQHQQGAVDRRITNDPYARWRWEDNLPDRRRSGDRS